VKNKAVLAIIGVVVVVGIIGAVVYGLNQKKSSDTMHMDMNKSGSTSKSSSDAATATNAVSIDNFAFSPSAITVKVGTKVTWTNRDGVQHSVIGDNLSELNSPAMDKGATYSFTFTKAGSYTYHCGIHPSMTGTVEVTS
jgi:plastocyanin